MNFREQIWCVISEEMAFETFTPIWYHISENEKNWQKSKIKISTILWATLVETLPRSMHDFCGEWMWCVLSEEMSFEFFLPYGPMLMETKKKKRKKIKNFEKKKKNYLEIWWIGTCPQHLALIHSVVSEKTMSTDGRRTPAWRQYLSCAVAQSRANNTRPNVPHICVTSIDVYQISLHFTLRLRREFFEMQQQAILEKVHWINPKWSWTLHGQLYPIHVLLLTNINESKMSGRITLRPTVFEIHATWR